MAVAAEQVAPTIDHDMTHEQYARSLRMLRHLGGLAIEGAGDEYAGVRAFVRDDFISAVEENLKTDAEFREQLDIEPTRQFAVIDGHVTASDGQTMESVIERGLEHSRTAAESDPRMATQVRRDEGDWLTVQTVDGLQPGEAYTVVSMDPKEAMTRDGQKFWKDKGYRPGLAFIQFYYKDHDGVLLTGSYSVEGSNKDAWRQVQQRYGVTIPEDTPADDWIRYGDRRTMTAEQARTYASELRQDYYQHIGKSNERHSVTELIRQKRQLVDAYFDSYMLPLAEAIHTGKANETIQGLIQAFVARPGVVDKLAADSRRELIRAANSTAFTPEAGRLVEELVRYALVEELRKSVVQLVHNRKLSVATLPNGVPVTAEYISSQLLENVSSGLEAGRSYGGCAASLKSSEGSESGDSSNPQSAFGGREGSGEEANIPTLIRCIKCGQKALKQQVVRERSWRCPHCKYEIDVCNGAVLHGAEQQPASENTVEQAIAELFRRFRNAGAQPAAA